MFLLASAPLAAAQDATRRTDDPPTYSSVERIRAELERTPRLTTQTLDATPHFALVVRETRPFEYVHEFDFSSGPIPPGGLYAYEQQQRIGPAMSQPLVIVDLMPIARMVAGTMRKHQAAARLAAARAETAHAIADYCAAQPGHGEGIRICETR
jgi:hypothetical protein